jgi:hypothetical protein
MTTAAEIAWLAGILEGEGHFGYMAYTPRVDLWMSDEDVIQRAASLVRKAVSVRKPQNGKIRPLYGFTACGAHAIGIMLTTYTLLGYRRREAIRASVARWTAPKMSPSDRGKLAGAKGGPAMFAKYGRERFVEMSRLGHAARWGRG